MGSSVGRECGRLRVRVFAVSALDCGFEVGSNQRLKLVFVASSLDTQHYGVRGKTGCHGNRVMCYE